MSCPPIPIPVGKGQTFVSFVIRFRLQSVPWRQEKLVYHALSVRRWITRPLSEVPIANTIVYDATGFLSHRDVPR